MQGKDLFLYQYLFYESNREATFQPKAENKIIIKTPHKVFRFSSFFISDKLKIVVNVLNTPTKGRNNGRYDSNIFQIGVPALALSQGNEK